MKNLAVIAAACFVLLPLNARAGISSMEMPDGTTAFVTFEPQTSTANVAKFLLHINFEKSVHFKVRTRTSAGLYLNEHDVKGTKGSVTEEAIIAQYSGDANKVWAQWEYLEDSKPFPPGHPELGIIPSWTVGERAFAQVAGTLSTDFATVMSQFMGLECPNKLHVGVVLKVKKSGWFRFVRSVGSSTDPVFIPGGQQYSPIDRFTFVPKRNGNPPAGNIGLTYGVWDELRYWQSGTDNPSTSFPPPGDVAQWTQVISHTDSPPLHPYAKCAGQPAAQ